MPDQSGTGDGSGTPLPGSPEFAPTSASEGPAAAGEPETAEARTQQVDLSAELRSIARRLDRFERDFTHDRRTRDKWGTEMGQIRDFMRELPNRLANSGPIPDPNSDLAGYLDRKLKDMEANLKGGGEPQPGASQGETREEYLQRVADAQEDFLGDFPDSARYDAQIAAMLRTSQYRVYDPDGKLNPYKSMKLAYGDAVLASRGGKTAAAAARVSGAIEAAKADASISGVSASGTERATLKGLTQQDLRKKSLKELVAIGESLNLVPANDRPR